MAEQQPKKMWDAWRRELSWCVAGVLLLGGVGLLAGHPYAFLLIGLVAYLAWMLFQLNRFVSWLMQPKKRPPPVPVGVWAPLSEEITVLRERGRRRKRKIGRVLSRFQASTNALPDATVVIDETGVVEWWNDAARKMLGLTKKRDKGKRIDKLITDPVFRRYFSKEKYQQPLHMPAPVDEEIGLEVRIVPFGKGKRLLQARDVTRLEQLETVRRDFVANVSHEMRTPLTVIHGYLEMMADSQQEGLAPWRGAMEQMRYQSSRIQRIVEDLLLLSRLDSDAEGLPQETVAVARLLKTIQTQAMELSNGRHRIELEVDAALGFTGIGSELESAFSNLVFNAVRYTPDGGEIFIRWRQERDGPAFSVQDNGIGIAAEHLPRITERFYRVDVARSRESGGTGLGLAIVKHVLARHEGRLSIESKPGEGSLFICSFPASRAHLLH